MYTNLCFTKSELAANVGNSNSLLICGATPLRPALMAAAMGPVPDAAVLAAAPLLFGGTYFPAVAAGLGSSFGGSAEYQQQASFQMIVHSY